MTEDFHGHLTKADGSHVSLSADEAKAIWESIEAAGVARAVKLPDQQSAIDAMMEAWVRLKELGWRDAIYCPKDGSRFQVIECGSTGVFDCSYSGKWPDGYWMTADGGDCYPSSRPPTLFKLYPEDQAKHDTKMAEARAKYAARSTLDGDGRG